MLVYLIGEKFENVGLTQDKQLNAKWTETIEKVFDTEEKRDKYVEDFGTALREFSGSCVDKYEKEKFDKAVYGIYTAMHSVIILPEELPEVLRDMMYNRKPYTQIKLDLAEGKYLQ